MRHCPASWLRESESFETSAKALESVLEDKDPERLLLTHGGPRAASEL